jgi:4-amino-4-deoxy-L-arabinose transferase-like glycosyltransferase
MSKKNRLKKKEAVAAASPGLEAAPSGVFRFAPVLCFAALLVWFFVVYKNYFPSHPLAALAAGISRVNFPAVLSGFLGVLPSNALNLLFLALFLVLSCGLGGGLLSLFGLAIPAGERFIFSLGLGFGAIAYIMLLLGALGALNKSLILPIFLLGSAVSAYKIKIWTFRAGALKRELAELRRLGSAWNALALLGALFCLLNIVMAFVPETFYDSHVYHLAAPGYYLLKHSILPMSFLSHSNFPLNQSMLYTLALALGSNETLAKLIHCTMGLLTVLLIYLSVKRFYNVKTAFFAALIFCSTPIFALNSWTCGNDVGLTFFFTLAYLTYLGWLQTGGAGPFALFSVFSGVAAGTKYTAAFSIAGLAVSLAVRQWRISGPVNAVKKLALYSGTVFLFLLPWLLKNYIFTRNPFQPFFYAALGGENLKLVSGGTAGILNTPQNLVGFKITSFLASPWTLTLNGGDSLTYIGPVFLLLLPCLLFFRRTDRLIKYSLVMFSAGYAAWYLGTPAYRYMLPLFTALSVCLGWAAYFISERFKIFKLLFAAILAVNFGAVLTVACALGLDAYFAKGASRDEFLSVSRVLYPNPPYAAIEWSNKNLPPDAKVFFIGESRPFRMKRDFLSYSVETNVQPLMAYLRKAKSADDLSAALRGDKFTHLLINYREAIRNHDPYGDLNWTKNEREIFDGFWKKHVRLEYFKEGVYVYSILADGVRTPPPNILEELEAEGWKNENLLKIFSANRMWAGCLEEYEMYGRYGYDVSKQTVLYKELITKE